MGIRVVVHEYMSDRAGILSISFLWFVDDDNRQVLIDRGSFPLRFESNEDFANIMFFSERYGIGMKYFSEYLEHINAVTKEDIMRVANQYIDSENFALVAVTDVEATKANFQQFGEVEIVKQ